MSLFPSFVHRVDEAFVSFSTGLVPGPSMTEVCTPQHNARSAPVSLSSYAWNISGDAMLDTLLQDHGRWKQVTTDQDRGLGPEDMAWGAKEARRPYPARVKCGDKRWNGGNNLPPAAVKNAGGMRQVSAAGEEVMRENEVRMAKVEAGRSQWDCPGGKLSSDSRRNLARRRVSLRSLDVSPPLLPKPKVTAVVGGGGMVLARGLAPPAVQRGGMGW